MTSPLADRIAAAGLTLPVRPSGRAYGRRDLHAWLMAHGVPCKPQEVRVMLEGPNHAPRARLHSVTAEQEMVHELTESLETSLEANLVDDKAQEVSDGLEQLIRPAGLPDDIEWIGTTAKVGKDYIRVKPKAAAASLPETSLDDFRQRLLGFDYVRDFVRSKPISGPPVALNVTQADPQLGKPGTKRAVHNWLGGVDLAVEEGFRLMENGLNIVEVIDDNGGDPIEGLFNYANQAWVLELNLIDQLDLAIDCQLLALKKLSLLGLPIKHLAYESNHSEASRAGKSKEITTTTSDSFDYHIANQVERIARLTPGLADVEFISPRQGEHGREFFVYLDVCGTGTYYSHGHKEHGRGAFQEAKSLDGVKRVAWAYRDRMSGIKLAITKHWHHFFVQGNADFWNIGASALEDFGSSDYLLGSGIYSRPGVMTVVIGKGAGTNGWTRPMVHTPIQLAEVA